MGLSQLGREFELWVMDKAGLVMLILVIIKDGIDF